MFAAKYWILYSLFIYQSEIFTESFGIAMITI
jgi:hypothetical protein